MSQLLHITTTTLLLCYFHRQPCYVPFLVANSLVGGLWMMVEHDVIFTEGIPFFVRWRIHMDLLQNIVFNLLVHGVLSVVCLHRIDTSRPRFDDLTVVLWVLGFLFFDINFLYPCKILPIEVYAAMHLFVVLIHLGCNGTND